VANKAKIRKLIRFLKKEPRRYCQDRWFQDVRSKRMKNKPPCGTLACLAGEAVLMEGYKPYGEMHCTLPDGSETEEVSVVAQKILGLRSKQADYLFVGDCSGWPEEAARAYENATDPSERVNAAIMALKALL
jgi:hypothetical protein